MNFVEALDVRIEEIASACTLCGRYFQACPMTVPSGIKDAEPTKVLSGIVDILRGNAGSVEAEG
jgi:Fe-S oxidoreductase